jgi:hypothetical protein
VAAPAPLDLPALAAALAGCGTGDGQADPPARREMLTLAQRLRQREQELASALIQIAALKAAVQAR